MFPLSISLSMSLYVAPLLVASDGGPKGAQWNRLDLRERVLRSCDGTFSPAFRARVSGSPVCTHALATYLGWPVSPALAAELDRITSEGVYERQVLFVRNLRFCEPTAARRISFRESPAFETIREESYRAFGYEITDIPADDLAHRVDTVSSTMLRRYERETRPRPRR